jgi:hypothetical protein
VAAANKIRNVTNQMLQHAIVVVGVAGVRELVITVNVPESFKLDYDTGSVCTSNPGKYKWLT